MPKPLSRVLALALFVLVACGKSEANPEDVQSRARVSETHPNNPDIVTKHAAAIAKSTGATITATAGARTQRVSPERKDTQKTAPIKQKGHTGAAAAAYASAAALHPEKNEEEEKLHPMESKYKGALFGALVGDALTLGAHHEMDAKKIKDFYVEMDRFHTPGEKPKTSGERENSHIPLNPINHHDPSLRWQSRSLHDGNGRGVAKTGGDQTDYGDYTILFLEHFAETSDQPHLLEVEEFIPRWKKALKTWRSHIDEMTMYTLNQVKRGEDISQLGGPSQAMALRFAGAFGYYDVEDDLVEVAKRCMFTHVDKFALAGAEFFARVTFRVLHKKLNPRAAIFEVANESGDSVLKEKVYLALDKVHEAEHDEHPLSKEEFADDLALTQMARLWDVGHAMPIKVGKASHTEGTLPGSIYFIVKYEDNLIKALQANAMVGGDSGSRAMAIGMVLGAFHGMDAIPYKFGKGGLTEWNRAEDLVNKLPLVRKYRVKDEL